MAIYHFSMKTISRSAGRTATAAAAYRAGAAITDRNTGEVHNYVYKKGVSGKGIVLPKGSPKWAFRREELWNEAEAAEKRKNSTVAREIVVALPAELDGHTRARLVRGFVEKLVIRHKCAVDYAIHEPNSKGDDRNHHAHLLMTTRRLTSDGFSEKTRELDDRKSGEVDYWRKEWALHVNRYLAAYKLPERISHLSLAEQGIEREPTKHKGVAATAIERRTRESVLENSELNIIEKSRALRTLSPQVSGNPEPLSGYRFGQEPPRADGLKAAEAAELVGKVSGHSALELFMLSADIEQEEMNLYNLMDERSEVVRRLEAEQSYKQALEKIGRGRLLSPSSTLSPYQQKGLDITIQAMAQVRDQSGHLPYTDRLKQFGDSVNHVADEAAAGRNLGYLEAVGRAAAKPMKQETEHSRGKGDDYGIEI